MPIVKNEPMVQNILFMFIFIGLIIKFFLSQKTSEDGLTGPATATKWGFGIILISVSLLIFISIGQLKDTGTISIIPHFIMIGTMIWFILININHGERINKGEVGNGYNTYTNAFTFVIFIQICIIIGLLSCSNDMIKNKPVYVALSFLLSVIRIVLLSIVNIILKYYSTDG